MATYKDKNGVVWSIEKAADDSFFGFPVPGAGEREYDLEKISEASDVTSRSEGGVAGEIEKFAARNRGSVALRVTATAPGNGLALALLVGLVIYAMSE